MRCRPAIGVLPLACFCISCQQPAETRPPPEAQRPVLKSRDELAAERRELIAAGAVVPAADAGIVEAERQSLAAARRRPVPVAPPNARQGDILLVNEGVLTVAEVLYGVRERLEEIRRVQTRAGFLEQIERIIRRQTQQEIGSLLVYEKAMKGLTEQQLEALERTVRDEFDKHVARQWGGSTARLERHLVENGMTLEQFKAALKRQIVVRQYARELLLPKTTPRRDELLAYYREHESRFRTPEMREFLLIDAPFESFLPYGVSWQEAAPAARAQARLQAQRHIRAAHAALAERPFEDVAREMSRGPQAEQGGSWGMIGRPLQPPYDVSSRLIFEFDEGQVGEPLESERGWCLVKCGAVSPAGQVSFAEAQEDIRRQLSEDKFNQELAEYVLRLAAKATLSSLDLFVHEAVRRADSG
jgi:hypothetical protein